MLSHLAPLLARMNNVQHRLPDLTSTHALLFNVHDKLYPRGPSSGKAPHWNAALLRLKFAKDKLLIRMRGIQHAKLAEVDFLGLNWARDDVTRRNHCNALTSPDETFWIAELADMTTFILHTQDGSPFLVPIV
jgi:hypothetical protein